MFSIIVRFLEKSNDEYQRKWCRVDSKIALEYYRNNEGYDDGEFDEFIDFLETDSTTYLNTRNPNAGNKILKANQILGNRIRRDYLSFTFDRPFTFDDFFPHVGVTVSLDDGSFLLNGSLEYAVRDDTSITLDVKRYVGGDGHEYGLKPERSRVYLKVVYYF